MSLTVKHLNSDASFLLTFKPILHAPLCAKRSKYAFTILLDPWLYGTSTIWHRKFSISTQKEPSCISSLADIPEPDLVIISQDKTDHCHEATLKTLTPFGGKTKILAGSASAKTIRSWKYFDPRKVITLPKWKDRQPSTLYRVHLPALDAGGTDGEVTIAFIPQKHDITGLHNAIGITYRPPTSSASSMFSPISQMFPFTPPDSPNSSYPSSIHRTLHNLRNLSVIFAPHGCAYNKSIKPYAQSHLISEACLPLTALLHGFDRSTNAWYLGGNICAGFPGGQEIAQSLLARYWISAHDGVKETRGFASKNLVTEHYEKEEIAEVVSPRSEKFPDRRTGTEVVVLGVGEDLTIRPGIFGSN
jgi:hypothetical protein